MNLGRHPERFGLSVGDRVRTTKQYDEMGKHPTKYGYVVSFQDGCAWLQWNNGDRTLLGCAWIEPYHGPMDGEVTQTTIEEMLEGEG